MATVNILLLGAGNVGSKLLEIIRDRREHVRRHDGVNLRVIGITTTRGTRLDPAGLDLDATLAAARCGEAAPLRALDARAAIDEVAQLPCSVVVDATASTGALDLYEAAVRRSVAIVTANKLPLVGPVARVRALFSEARARGTTIRYETTVGADLPVFAPLCDRLSAGDRVFRIEGSLSGTLGFISDAVCRGIALESAIETARERGYTEPDPAQDLAGLDVARKATLLAREIGLDIELDDVDLEPFVRDEDRSSFDERTRATVARGWCLRYLAMIDPAAARPVRVGPAIVDAAHPAAALRGTEAMVAFTTERCDGVPIVVRGPGAGGLVTASGLFADIVKTAREAGSRLSAERGRSSSPKKARATAQRGGGPSSSRRSAARTCSS